MGSPCNCDECVPDPSLTCSYTGEDITAEDHYIANAYKGNLILSPGGGSSSSNIGRLLHNLSPPQHYTHMGIMVNDYYLIRHSTAITDRISAEEYYSGTILGVAAPTDGVSPDHLQFAWPGSVTQSFEQASFAEQYGENLTPPGRLGPYRGSHLTDRESPKSTQYRVAELSFDDIIDGGNTYPALVVKPCPYRETPAIVTVMGRIADQAMKLYTHYRFYCYTDGAIGGVLDFWGPPTELPDAQPDWDPVAMKYTDWSDPAQVKWVSKPFTIPAMCSSFVWQAVQEANKGGPPKIVLDWAASHTDALGDPDGKCGRAFPPDWAADSPFTLDGLYIYDEASRKNAAQTLHDSLFDEVYQDLKDSLSRKGGILKEVASAVDDVGKAGFIAAAEAGATAVLTLLSPVLTPAVVAVLDLALLEQLIELLYILPNKIANQVTNSFAFDCHRGFPADTRCVDAAGNEIRDVNSKNWSDAPGSGQTVSPDNLAMFWDAPGPSDVRETLRGVYGYNTPVLPVHAVIKKPKCELVPSTGTATIKGYVLYRGSVIAGAHVKANCQDVISGGEQIGYSLTVRSGGHYKVVARYEDTARGIIYYGERATGRPPDPPIAPGATISLDIDLIEPPECLRNVIVEGTVRVDDYYYVFPASSDADHDEKPFRKILYVQYGVPKFDENTATWVIDPDDPVGVARRTDVCSTGASAGDSHGDLKIEVKAQADLSVFVTVTGTLNPDEENLNETHSVTVPANATGSIDEFDLNTGGTFPDRAYFRDLKITNRPARAI